MNIIKHLLAVIAVNMLYTAVNKFVYSNSPLFTHHCKQKNALKPAPMLALCSRVYDVYDVYSYFQKTQKHPEKRGLIHA